MNPFNDIVYRQGKDGRIFQLHWKYRFGPLAPILMVAGAATSAFGEYRAGQESDAVSKYNQQVKEREAQAQVQRGVVESRQQAEEAARKMSALRAGIGSSGVVSSEGTPLQLIQEQTRQSELENMMIGYNAQMSASNLQEQGKQIRASGKAQKRASYIGAGTSLLTGFSNL